MATIEPYLACRLDPVWVDCHSLSTCSPETLPKTHYPGGAGDSALT